MGLPPAHALAVGVVGNPGSRRRLLSNVAEAGTDASERSETGLLIRSESRDCRKRAKRDGTVPDFRTASFSSFMGESERS